jgi:hypothetical protein
MTPAGATGTVALVRRRWHLVEAVTARRACSLSPRPDRPESRMRAIRPSGSEGAGAHRAPPNLIIPCQASLPWREHSPFGRAPNVPGRRAGILPAGCRGFQPRVNVRSFHHCRNFGQDARRTGRLEACPTPTHEDRIARKDHCLPRSWRSRNWPRDDSRSGRCGMPRRGDPLRMCGTGRLLFSWEAHLKGK